MLVPYILIKFSNKNNGLVVKGKKCDNKTARVQFLAGAILLFYYEFGKNVIFDDKELFETTTDTYKTSGLYKSNIYL